MGGGASTMIQGGVITPPNSPDTPRYKTNALRTSPLNNLMNIEEAKKSAISSGNEVEQEYATIIYSSQTIAGREFERRGASQRKFVARLEEVRGETKLSTDISAVGDSNSSSFVDRELAKRENSPLPPPPSVKNIHSIALGFGSSRKRLESDPQSAFTPTKLSATDDNRRASYPGFNNSYVERIASPTKNFTPFSGR
jgi:hypothetical protein